MPDSETKTKPVLDQAIAACRDHEREHAERFSASVRAGVISSALSTESSAPRWGFPLFSPVRIVTLAGLLPVAIVAAVTVWMVVDPAPEQGDRPVTVEVAKVGDRVVFEIDNGFSDHVVIRSEQPDRFDVAGAERVVDASFADRLESGPDLVFYRID